MALREARRILKPKGVLIAAAISRFASLIDGLARGFFCDSDFRKIVASDLATGQHRNPTSQTAYFTTAYFHRPEELAAEVREAIIVLLISKFLLLRVQSGAQRSSGRLGMTRCNERA
jgi:ubiquinone/menaquinone biosynthesis C-methylase UbiE